MASPVVPRLKIPDGNRDVGAPMTTCPLERGFGAVMVQVYDGNLLAPPSDMRVVLNGPSKGEVTAHNSCTTCFKKVVPGNGYSVTVSPTNLGKYEGVRLRRTSPKEGIQDSFAVSEGGIAWVIFRFLRRLELVEVDHHFVPGPEELEIAYNIESLAGVKVLLQILNDNHTPPLLFERELTAAEKANGDGKILKWDGRATCASGPLKDKVINPLYGPCKVRLLAPDYNIQTADTDKSATRVLYHSIHLRPCSYLENDSPPPQGSIEWVQYRLNQLGYFAGPIDGVLNQQTKRAVKRYTYEMVNGTETDAAGGAGFLSSLAGTDLLTPLFSDAHVIEDRTKDSKIYIQHNYFYHTEGASGTSNWNQSDGHWYKESDFNNAKGGKLDRFESPVEAVLTLESRLQKTFDSSHAGIKSPDALGEAQVEWTVIDPPEDTAVLPACVPGTSPCAAIPYIAGVRAKVTGIPNPTGAGDDNCPPVCGGVNSAFFDTLLPQYTARPGTSARRTISTMYQDDGTHPDCHGRTAVLFRASHIGGDNFIVNAAISFTGTPDHPAIEDDHKAFQLAASYGLPPSGKVKYLDKILFTQTGTMTVWRRRRASAVLDWSELAVPAVDWTEIVSAFNAAFTEFDVSSVETRRIDHFIQSQADAAPYLDAVAGWWTERTADRAKMVFTHKHMFPFSLELGKKEKPEKFKDRIIGEATNFNALLTRITLGSDTRISVGEWLAGAVRKTRRPGVIVLRAVPYSGTDVTRTSGLFQKKTKVVEAAVGRNLGSSCTGVGGGVAYICEGYRSTLKDGFLVAHEIAHCYYLTHPFQVGVDHDMGDRNCTMWYLHSAQRPYGRPQLDMSRGSAYLSKFCGKCLLKLRGWRVADTAYTKTPAYSLPPATPCKPVMAFVKYEIVDGSYWAVNPSDAKNPDIVELSLGATDPKDPNTPKTVLGPLKFLHVHRLTWESTDDNLGSLTGIRTREKVKFDQPTQAPPFCDAADPDREFVQVGDDANEGTAFDDHSVMLPALICARPLAAGSVIGQQWYQYSVDGKEWIDIPQAVYRLEKSVYYNGAEWVLKFVKSNWAPDNPNAFSFEMHYKIGAAPARPPLISPNSKKGTPAKPFVAANSTRYQSGDRTAEYRTTTSKVVTYDEIEAMGLVPSAPWII
jgi:Putative peptidoglycan binding domain